MEAAIFFGGIFIVIYLLYLNNRNETERKKVLDHNKNRPQLKKEAYIEQLAEKGFEKKHIEAYYDETKKIIGIENFTMYPEDNIYENYCLWDLDDIDLIDNVCEKLGIRKAEQKDLDELGKTFNTMNAESVLTLMKMLEKKNS
ncbi:hypothetical protein FEE95_11790 [Maribacter algarum]|uniref:Uncharacterized protein n=1 Tax=Maribacter algarum (ex Zhang et al. 2020) TaxID=2578118 RepID=A0A5S3PQZ5_9FLAO|nr:hypothetical protein [Maribacter algarum]TMM57166.1 hypothetical protein FEE95_11790 [Maribacter algarum]